MSSRAYRMYCGLCWTSWEAAALSLGSFGVQARSFGVVVQYALSSC